MQEKQERHRLFLLQQEEKVPREALCGGIPGSFLEPFSTFLLFFITLDTGPKKALEPSDE